MSRTHNKKRNTALLYEFLVRTVSSALVEGDKKTSSTALKILKRFFKPGTQLYKEFRLFNSLVKTTVTSDGVSSSIINEARSAAAAIDMVVLDREKSQLIRSINYLIKNENFFDQPVSEYRMYATIQTLMNEWRKKPGTADIDTIAKYEQSLRDWLLSEKKGPDQTITDDSPGTSRLLMKVMMKKLNEKYSSTLNSDQKEIIRSYAFSTAKDDSTTILKKLAEVRSNLSNLIDDYSVKHPENKFIVDKMLSVKQEMLSESLESVDDSTVSRFMLYSALSHELIDSDGEEK
jgi:hypothetical protein